MASWEILQNILRAEAGAEIAARIESRLRAELGGLRITIPALHQARVTDEQLRRTLREKGWNVDAAAKALGIHRTTVYRRLEPKRAPKRADGYFAGRLVR